jgi:hypothetical protein
MFPNVRRRPGGLGHNGKWMAVETRGYSVLPLCYHGLVAVRKKRSISIPPDLDAEIETAANKAGLTYSAWLAAVARKEFTLRAGLEAVDEFEREHGRFSDDEVAEAEAWARDTVGRGRRSGARESRTA